MEEVDENPLTHWLACDSIQSSAAVARNALQLFDVVKSESFYSSDMAEKKDDPATGSVPKVTYFLRDFNPNMSAAWHEEFSAYEDAVKV